MLGASDFLLKPLGIEEVVTAVDRAIDLTHARNLSVRSDDQV
jgi:FixJ family two-component response regulator